MTSGDGQPTLASLVLEAARKEREKGNIGGDDATADGQGAAKGGSLAGTAEELSKGKKKSDDAGPEVKRKLFDRSASSSSAAGPNGSAKPSSGSDVKDDRKGSAVAGTLDGMVGGGKFGRTLGKLAEAAGVREASEGQTESTKKEALEASRIADETGTLRGPFSIQDAKRGHHRKTREDSAETGAGGEAGKRKASQDQGQTGEEGDDEDRAKDKGGARGWSVLKSKLGASGAGQKSKDKAGLSKALTGHELTTELTTGLLPIIMLKMSMDRDEHGHHRVPILMNYLKLRITDSVHPFHATHAVFRIELEYGDKLLRWVIYRELRDFVNLHTAYRASSLVARGTDIDLPTFPKTSLPYFNLLKREGRAESKADFAKMQRYALEDYLLRLLRATMFRPEANRLCKFLEISALSVSLATRGGFQGKQGYLRVLSSNASRRAKAGFHPLEWKERREPKWFIVRESYLVSVDEPDQSSIFDVFLVDDQFHIERPTRLIKQGIHILDVFEGGDGDKAAASAEEEKAGEWSKSSQDAKKTKKKGGKKGEEQLRRSHQKEDSKAEDDQGREEDEDDAGAAENGRPGGVGDPEDPSTTDLAAADPKTLKNASSHTFYIVNAERKVKVVAKNERQMDQFIASIERMAARCIWAGKNRFASFAPIRMNVAAQWLIDGRDYFWNLSRALLLAKERVYIHDWWLSPELYLRRPPALNQKWRLDRLLKRKADEGVQIFIIVYKEVSNGFTPVESDYTKKRLLALSPNIHIQRSPSHTGTGNLLWSHHEKMCVIDETIAFMGGLDLCFGRWDSPGHVLIDDAPGGLDAIERHDPKGGDDVGQLQIWPGKDYSNQRVSDFFNLKQPEEDMYDRSKVPRQPWHDIGLQLVGQPARDLCRHFAQRWNYLLRTKNHTRVMPFLLPPADFTPKQLQNLGIVGTCEAQICRSAGPWSIGTPEKTEHSIQNAYAKAIQMSDHFVYIENQFFVTSTVVEGTQIVNKIGDALVERAIRAHEEGTPWRAVIVIPTMPGYPSPLNEDAAGSVRLIVECQNRSICRGETSIYGRLRARGIQPEEYVTFFSLRSWGKLGNGQLTSEGVYIHAKAMVVDDRLAIIGSANINERSQRGDRDSELACVIRDTDMIDSVMAGKPYKVGRFAHSMRIRLMREHLGVDVDALEALENNMDLLDRHPKEEIKPENDDDEDKKASSKAPKKDEDAIKGETTKTIGTDARPWDPDHEQTTGLSEGGVTETAAHRGRVNEAAETVGGGIKSVAVGAYESAGFAAQRGMEGTGKPGKLAKAAFGEEDTGPDTYDADDPHDGQPDGAPVTEAEKLVAGETTAKGHPSTLVPTLEEKVMAEGRPQKESEEKMADGDTGRPGLVQSPPEASKDNDASTRGVEGEEKEAGDRLEAAMGQPTTQTSEETSDVHKLEQHAAKQGKTEVKDEDADGKEAKPQAFANGNANAGEEGKDEAVANNNYYQKEIRRHLTSGMTPINIPVAAPEIDPKAFTDPVCDPFFKEVWLPVAVRNTQIFRKVFRCVPDDNVTTWQGYKEYQTWEQKHGKPLRDEDSAEKPGGSVLSSSTNPAGGEDGATADAARNRGLSVGGPQAGRDRSASDAGAGHKKTPSKPSKGDEGFTQKERDQMEEVLREVRGNLILFPTRFMEAEDLNNNFLFSKDRLPPLSIYN